ncbi:5575_t:CDS:1 [Cetraspora pellucida]|uniref:5575_t:CDS:1 n=1 Tax=Cetraspora pellucida TaxID=1433469 RepID=A0ACA9LM46_9GLOM|nr:5575_t:CDS:1 [Cetraspora pellucida]
MSNAHHYHVTLLDVGSIVYELHYGLYAQNWWTIHSQENNRTIVPFRLYMRLMCLLNKQQFFVTVIQKEKNILHPGFICTSGNSSSGVQTSLSNAITIAYNTIFKTKTTFSGPAVIGLDQINITSQLLEDVYFIPIFLTLDKISIVISNIGDTDTYDGFISSLITAKGKNHDRYLIQQQIVNNKFILDFYKGTNLEFHYEDESALTVWKKAKILTKYNGTDLFGYLHSSVVQERLTKSMITYTSQHWHSIEKLNAVFDRHIKSRKLNMSSMLKWHSLFFNWLKEGHSIIQLDKVLQSIYLPTYQLQDKDICAWKAMLNACGCTNITPFTKDISQLEFWMRSKNPTIDRANLKKLYQNKMLDLNIIPPITITNSIEVNFWNAFKQSLNCNKSGPYNRTRILSIIVEKFAYLELQEKLQV